jgi:hypothetical protein
MKIYDEKKVCEDIGEKMEFRALRYGAIFTYGGRVLLKVTPFWRPYLKAEANRCEPPILNWEKINAVRLGHIGQPCHDRDGFFSTFSNDTEVVHCPDAAIYLKG